VLEERRARVYELWTEREAVCSGRCQRRTRLVSVGGIRFGNGDIGEGSSACTFGALAGGVIRKGAIIPSVTR
jgi:hypothetical protein